MNIDSIGTTTINSDMQGKNIDTLMMYVMIERAEELEKTVRTIASDIQKANTKLKEINDLKVILSTLDKKGDSCTITGEQADILKNTLGDQFDDLFTYSSTSGELKARADNSSSTANMALDGEIGSLNSMSQMTMVELQSTMDKYNNAYSLASNFVSKYTSSISSIASNIR